jgi:hypothetical protein
MQAMRVFFLVLAALCLQSAIAADDSRDVLVKPSVEGAAICRLRTEDAENGRYALVPLTSGAPVYRIRRETSAGQTPERYAVTCDTPGAPAYQMRRISPAGMPATFILAPVNGHGPAYRVTLNPGSSGTSYTVRPQRERVGYLQSIGGAYGQ